MVLSTAKIMIMATPPVATVVTIFRTASGTPKAAVTGFQIQVNRFMISMTAMVPPRWQSA